MNFQKQLESELESIVYVSFNDDGIGYYEYGSESGVDRQPALFHELTADEITVTFHVKELSEIEETFTWQPERGCTFEIRGKLMNLLGSHNDDEWKIKAKYSLEVMK